VGTEITTLMTLYDQRREADLGHALRSPPGADRPGAARPPVLTLADRLPVTALHQRLASPQVAIAASSLSAPRRSTGASATSASSWTKPDMLSSPVRTACPPRRALQPRGRGGHRRSSGDQDSKLIICKL